MDTNANKPEESTHICCDKCKRQERITGLLPTFAKQDTDTSPVIGIVIIDIGWLCGWNPAQGWTFLCDGCIRTGQVIFKNIVRLIPGAKGADNFFAELFKAKPRRKLAPVVALPPSGK